MKLFFVVLVSVLMVYAEGVVVPTKKGTVTVSMEKKSIVPVKTVTPIKTVSKKTYEQQVKELQGIYKQQVASIEKSKQTNEALINKATSENQRLTSKLDSLTNSLKSNLQAALDDEMKKVQENQDNIDKRKTEIDKLYKDAVSGLPQK